MNFVRQYLTKWMPYPKTPKEELEAKAEEVRTQMIKARESFEQMADQYFVLTRQFRELENALREAIERDGNDSIRTHLQ